MGAHARQSIRLDLLARMIGVEGLSSSEVFDEDDTPKAANLDRFIVVVIDSESAIDNGKGDGDARVFERTLDVTIGLRAKTYADLEAMAAEVERRMRTVLGEDYLPPSTEFGKSGKGERPHAAANLAYQITYQTSERDPETIRA